MFIYDSIKNFLSLTPQEMTLFLNTFTVFSGTYQNISVITANDVEGINGVYPFFEC